MRKLPEDAYAIYLAMGPRRSHDAVGKQCGVDKKTVTNRAVKENWKGRIAEYERKQREEAEKRARESLDAMNDRQLKVASFIQARAIESLKSMPLDNAMDAVRAYKLAAEMERDLRGKPDQATAVEVEEKIRGEHERWMPTIEEQPDVAAPTCATAQDVAPEAEGGPAASTPELEAEPEAAAVPAASALTLHDESEFISDDEPEPPTDGGPTPETSDAQV